MGILDAPSVPPTAAGLQALETKRATALRTFHAALANREAAPAKVLCVGDSMTEGQGATAQSARWVNRLRYLLRSRFPTTGVTPSPATDYLGLYTTGSTTFPVSATWTGGNPSLNTAVGIKRGGPQLTSTVTSVSIPVTGTSVDLYWFRNSSGGTFSYAVDGGAATNVATSGTGLGGSKTTISLGASGAHTLVLTWISGTSVVLEGLVVHDGDEAKGIKVFEAGHFGWTSSSYNIENNGNLTFWRSSITALAASLVVIRLGVNDYTQGVTPATMKTNLQSMINALNTDAGSVPPSIVLAADPERSGVGSPVAPWSDYAQVVSEVASGYSNACSFDARLRQPRAADDVWSLFSDGVHQTNKGQGVFADALGAFLAPR